MALAKPVGFFVVDGRQDRFFSLLRLVADARDIESVSRGNFALR